MNKLRHALANTIITINAIIIDVATEGMHFIYIYLIMSGTFLKKSPLEPPLASKIESSFFIKIYIYYFSALPDSLFSFSFLVGVRGQAKVVIPCWQSAQDICQVVGFVHSYCKLKKNYLPKVYLYHCYL